MKTVTRISGQMDAAALRGVSRAHKERCTELVKFIHRKMQDVRDSFFDVGEALAEINNNGLYKPAGHETFASLVEHEGFLAVSQAHKLIAVAEFLSREDAVTLGPEKAYALTRYAKALGDGGPVSALLHRRDAVDGKPIRDASVRELMRAAKAAQVQKRATPLDERRQQNHRKAREAQASLRKAGWARVLVEPKRRGKDFLFAVLMDEEQLQRFMGR